MKRNLQLDILRCVAILMVIGAHISVDNYTGITGWLARNWQSHGWLGVPIFFALSGYLISGLIFDELRVHGNFRVGRFLIRRGFKLYPAYYVFLIYLIAIPLLKDLYRGRDAISFLKSNLSDLLPNFFFLQNYIGPNPATHTWSLAVEEHFYLILPFMMLWLFRSRRLRALTILGLTSPLVFSLVRMTCVYFGDPYTKSYGYFATHLVLDGLGMGVGLRSLKEFFPKTFSGLARWRWVWLTLGVYLLMFGLPVPYISMTPVGSTMLLLGTLHLEAGDFGFLAPIGSPAIRLMGWIGMYSYSIYLWHTTFMGIASKKVISHLHLDPSRPGDWFLNRTLIVVAIVLGGWMTSRLVEWPVLHLRDRYFPRRA